MPYDSKRNRKSDLYPALPLISTLDSLQPRARTFQQGILLASLPPWMPRQYLLPKQDSSLISPKSHGSFLLSRDPWVLRHQVAVLYLVKRFSFQRVSSFPRTKSIASVHGFSAKQSLDQQMNMTRIQISAQKKPFLRIRVVQTRTWPRGELLEVVRQRLATCGWDGARDGSMGERSGAGAPRPLWAPRFSKCRSQLDIIAVMKSLWHVLILTLNAAYPTAQR